MPSEKPAVDSDRPESRDPVAEQMQDLECRWFAAAKVARLARSELAALAPGAPSISSETLRSRAESAEGEARAIMLEIEALEDSLVS